MPDNRPQKIEQLLEIWNRLTWSQRGTIFFFCFLGLASIVSLVYFIQKVEYQTLYTDLNSEDAPSIFSFLDKEKIKYIIDGTSIKVAANRNEVEKLRYDLEGSGQTGNRRVGYEIFDQTQFGMTDTTEQMNKLRAVEGELARNCEKLDAISWAIVRITPENEYLYEQDKQEAKASVTVKMKRGARLSQSGINGIRSIISSKVEGLSLRNVSIVDHNANLLTPLVKNGDEETNEMESSYRDQREKEISQEVINLLENIVGADRVHVSTSIDMDFNTTEQMEEQYNPNAQAIQSQQKSSERSGPSNSGLAMGVPGTESNLSTSVTPITGSVSENIRQQESTNYEVSKLVRHTVQPKGSIQRISVAVVVDHDTKYSEDENGAVTTTPIPRTKEELERYRGLVHTAIGYNALRGDVVTIENIPFYTDMRPVEPQPEEPVYVQLKEYIIPGMKYLVVFAVFILVYLIFLRPIRKRVSHALSAAAIGTGATTEAQLPEGNEAPALPGSENNRELESPIAGYPSNSELPARSSTLPENSVSFNQTDEQIERELMEEANMAELGNRKYAAMKNKLIVKAKNDPETVSGLIRTVLREGLDQ